MSIFAEKLKSTTMKYPIGIQSFERIREGGFVYVDKTAILCACLADITHILRRRRAKGALTAYSSVPIMYISSSSNSTLLLK